MEYLITGLDCNTNEGKISIFKDDMDFPKSRGDCIEDNVINIFPGIKKHNIYGMGTALTAASGQVLSEMGNRKCNQVIDSYFSREKGIGLNYLRLPIDSTDFSPYMYQAGKSLEDAIKGILDLSNDAKFILPFLDKIQDVSNGDCKLLFSPWSPPDYMKNNNSRIYGGKLIKEYYALWAKYIALYLKEYKDKGYNVWALTLQNEPNAIQIWDSAIFSAQEEKTLLSFVEKELNENNLSDVKIFFYDHNKERLLQRSHVYFDSAESIASGVAFHGYCGDHYDVLDIFRNIYPDKELIMSEFCIGINESDNSEKQLSAYSHEYINDFAHGASVIIDWNMILNEIGGPNHVANYCLSPMMFNRQTKSVDKNICFCVIEHLAKSISNGVSVIANSSYDSALDLLSVIDKQKNIRIVFSPKKDDELNFRIGEKVFRVKGKNNTIATLKLDRSDYEQN